MNPFRLFLEELTILLHFFNDLGISIFFFLFAEIEVEHDLEHAMTLLISSSSVSCSATEDKNL